VALGKDAREHREGFLGAVFFVTTEQDDMGSFAGSVTHPSRARGGREGDEREQEDDEGGEESHVTRTLDPDLGSRPSAK
jgi:hypothetical protein